MERRKDHKNLVKYDTLHQGNRMAGSVKGTMSHSKQRCDAYLLPSPQLQTNTKECLILLTKLTASR